MTRRHTLADARRSYTPEKGWAEMEGELPSYLIYRPLSLLLTPATLRLGITPTAITLAAMALALAMPAVALWGGERAYLAVAALALVHHVLDCLDGDVARTSGRTSRFGALLDGWGDLLFWVLYFAAIGLLVERAGAGPLAPYGLEIGLVLVALVLLHRNLRDSFALLYAGRAEWSARRPPRLSAGDLARIALFGLERAYAFGLIAAGALGALETLLAAIGVYVGLIFVGALWVTFAAARRRDAA